MGGQSLAVLSPTSRLRSLFFVLISSSPALLFPLFVVHLPVRSFESFIISLSRSFVVAGFHAKTLRLSLLTALHSSSAESALSLARCFRSPSSLSPSTRILHS